MKPKIRDDLDLVEFEDEIVIWNKLPGHDHGHLHYLNPISTLVFRLCDGTATVSETAKELAHAYGRSLEEMDRDVRELVRTFRRSGFLTQKPILRGDAEHDHHHHDHDGMPDHPPGHEGEQDLDDLVRDGRAKVRVEVPKST